jgi:hypothetical protein
MLNPLEKYGEQDESELRYGWIWGKPIKDHEGVIATRVAWATGEITVTVWELPEKNRKHARRPYEHIDTIQFANSTEYFAWLPTLENWNGVE